MRLSQAFAARDQMNKQELFKAFGDDPETMFKIRQAFIEGQRKWESELPALFGYDEAQRLKDALPKEINL